MILSNNMTSNNYTAYNVKEILEICGINIDISLYQKLLNYSGSINQVIRFIYLIIELNIDSQKTKYLNTIMPSSKSKAKKYIPEILKTYPQQQKFSVKNIIIFFDNKYTGTEQIKNDVFSNKEIQEELIVTSRVGNNNSCTSSKKKIKDALNKSLGEQTYRGKNPFICDGCSKKHEYGKVIFGGISNLHLCYECYKYAKEKIKSKRGNKHVFINTPM